MQIEVLKANEAQQPLISNLMELYLYEMSDIFHYDLGPDGRFGCDYLPLYWTDKKRSPYLITIDGRIAGFALVRQIVLDDESKPAFELEDFFLVRKWRKKGVEANFAQRLWKLHPGKWQVRCLREDEKGLILWQEAISHFTGSLNPPVLHEVGKHTWIVYHFTSEHYMEIDEEKLDAKLQLHREIDPAG